MESRPAVPPATTGSSINRDSSDDDSRTGNGSLENGDGNHNDTEGIGNDRAGSDDNRTGNKDRNSTENRPDALDIILPAINRARVGPHNWENRNSH
ncbi:hypothetical protein GGI23_004180 [Coemansia sp. RSA 2559]|nr:hypothetical protein GGI23_004180 [Coemansia sp. RSA 2559]